VPQPLDKVGELCGFDGKGRHVHKGVLTRCKWTYNDIKKQGVLKNLYSSMSPYKDYDLVVAGHRKVRFVFFYHVNSSVQYEVSGI
jgi:hypothetical protein